MPDDLRPGEIHHPIETAPAPAAATKVADGVWWIRMPLPFALDHINLWLLEDGNGPKGGWTVVDTGIADNEVKDLWREQFTGTMAGQPVQRIVVTHFHPDHIGNAGWLADVCEAPVWITRTEWLMHQMLVMDRHAVFQHAQIDAYEAAGLGPEWTTPLREFGNLYAERVEHAPTSYVRLQRGDEIAIGAHRWRVMIGTGHAFEHACLYCAELGVLISGDQILPRITPNISLWANDADGDPLGDYLDSLPQFLELPADTLVLPSHRLPFTGLHARVAQLAQHHQERLAEVLAACETPMTAADILPVMFKRQLDLHQIGFAMGEALAHLAHLVKDGRLKKGRRADGVAVYQRV